MLKANVHPRVVQEMLGHANISQTMDTYSHVLPNMQQAAERMDEMLGQGRGSGIRAITGKLSGGSLWQERGGHSDSEE